MGRGDRNIAQLVLSKYCSIDLTIGAKIVNANRVMVPIQKGWIAIFSIGVPDSDD